MPLFFIDGFKITSPIPIAVSHLKHIPCITSRVKLTVIMHTVPTFSCLFLSDHTVPKTETTAGTTAVNIQFLFPFCFVEAILPYVHTHRVINICGLKLDINMALLILVEG